MTSCEILNMALAEGVVVSLTETGDLKIIGGKAAIENWKPIIRKNKARLTATLTERKIAPAYCRNCERLEFIAIEGEAVAGCLYPAAGPYPEGWRRIPAGVKRCTWTSAAKEAKP